MGCVRQTTWFSICEPSFAVEAETTTAAGSVASTSAPVTTSVTPATAAIDDTCAGPWEQCGGNGWTGTTCCASGYFCNALSEWHSPLSVGGSLMPAGWARVGCDGN